MNHVYLISKAKFAFCLTILLTLLSHSATADNAELQGDPERGAELYLGYSCYACHGYTGETGTGTRLNPPRFNLQGFLIYVRNPSGRRVKYGPAGKMPIYSADTVSDEDLTDIYAYLTSLSSNSPPLEDIPLLNN